VSVCHHCDAPTDEALTTCDECGRPVGTHPIERSGARFTVWRGAVLPPFCVRCGAPARDDRWKRTYYWHEPALYVLIVAGVLVYAIVAMIVRKKIELAVPMCEAHWQRRGRLRKIALALLVLAVGLVALAIGVESVAPFSCCGAFLAGLASLIVYLVSERSLSPKRITDEYAEFGGASPEFLAVLE